MTVIAHQLDRFSTRSSYGWLKMGEVIEVDGCWVRTAVAQGGELRMTAVEVAYVRIDRRSTLFALQISMALGATDVRGFSQPSSP